MCTCVFVKVTKCALVHSPQLNVNVSSLILMCVISGKRRGVTEESGSHKPTQRCMKARERKKEVPYKVQSTRVTKSRSVISADPVGFLTPPSYVTVTEL